MDLTDVRHPTPPRLGRHTSENPRAGIKVKSDKRGRNIMVSGLGELLHTIDLPEDLDDFGGVIKAESVVQGKELWSYNRIKERRFSPPFDKN